MGRCSWPGACRVHKLENDEWTLATRAYDAKGRMTEALEYAVKGPPSRTTQTWSKDGLTRTWTLHLGNGQAPISSTTQFDSQGRTVSFTRQDGQVTVFDWSGSQVCGLRSETVYADATRKKVISKATARCDGSTPVERVDKTEGQPDRTLRFTMDKQKRPASLISTKGDETTMSMRYEYSADGREVTIRQRFGDHEVREVEDYRCWSFKDGKVSGGPSSTALVPRPATKAEFMALAKDRWWRLSGSPMRLKVDFDALRAQVQRGSRDGPQITLEDVEWREGHLLVTVREGEHKAVIKAEYVDEKTILVSGKGDAQAPWVQGVLFR